MGQLSAASAPVILARRYLGASTPRSVAGPRSFRLQARTRRTSLLKLTTVASPGLRIGSALKLRPTRTGGLYPAPGRGATSRSGSRPRAGGGGGAGLTNDTAWTRRVAVIFNVM